MELKVENVHQLLPPLLNYIRKHGVERASRNGPVLVVDQPVTVTYLKPRQRVMFWSQRDANPALHLYESLWMLRGRNDVAPMERYAKQFNNYSDDGTILHGAYGHRWRYHFGYDQLLPIIKRLRADQDDRRCVLQMWDARVDLDRDGRDVPCNMIATFQRDYNGALDLTVYNRSNDAVWGLAGANAVHFGFLLEYMANAIGCPVGRYNQITTNLHAYLKTLEPLAAITRVGENPYKKVVSLDLPTNGQDREIRRVVGGIDFLEEHGYFPDTSVLETGWGRACVAVLTANYVWRLGAKEERYNRALKVLSKCWCGDIFDFAVAQREWFERREIKYRGGASCS